MQFINDRSKKISVLLLATCSLVIVSCSKENTGNGTLEDNSFSFDGKSYTATQVFFEEDFNYLKAQNITPTSGLNNVTSVTVSFVGDNPPTQSGIYDIVRSVDNSDDKDNPKRIGILCTSFPYMVGNFADDKHFYPTTNPRQTAQVTIENNKITVKFSNITMINDKDDNTTTASANIIQP